MIDWTGALEAVHTDGRVVAIDRRNTSKRTTDTWWVELDSRVRIAADDGQVYGTDWSIRNVAAWRTSAEQLDRMNALVQRISAAAGRGIRMIPADELAVIAEAKAILAAREPVDPRFDKALAVIKTNAPLLADDAARRFARDVLAALDA